MKSVVNWLIETFSMQTNAARARAIQFLAIACLITILGLALVNLLEHFSEKSAGFGFAFLSQMAGFDVNESAIRYQSNDSYLRVILVGVVNTLHLTMVCIVFSTLIGFVFGLAKASSNRAYRGIAGIYVEFMRNTPKLLLVLLVYVLLVRELPDVRNAITVLSNYIYISNRGIHLPRLIFEGSEREVFLSLYFGAPFVALGLWYLYCKFGRLTWGTVLLLGGGIWVFAILLFGFGLDNTVTLEVPFFNRFNYVGGSTISIPFLTLTIALSFYHGGQITEIVRSGIEAIPSGQIEAGRSFGLSGALIMWLIVLPQSLRVILPPLTNQYLNLMKNTSIGLAVGYSDLVSVMTTSINQTFRPVELMLLTMGVYLCIGIAVSVLLNFYDKRQRRSS